MEGGEGVIVCFLRYTPPILRPRTRLRAKLYVHEKNSYFKIFPFTIFGLNRTSFRTYELNKSLHFINIHLIYVCVFKTSLVFPNKPFFADLVRSLFCLMLRLLFSL